MRKIILRVSDARKKYADSVYEDQAIEIDRRHSHIRVEELTFVMMRQQEKLQYFQIYASWLKEKLQARLATYLDVFRGEDVIPDDADLSNISWALSGVLDRFIAYLPQELKLSIGRLGREEIIEDARRDINLFAQKMNIDKMRSELQKPQPHSIHYNIQINENRGAIQQGGEGNIQSIDRSDDETK